MTPHRCCCCLFAGCQNSTALNWLHCSIISKVKVNFAHVCGFDTRRAPRNCSRFENVLDSVHVPILPYCCTRIQYVALAIILSDSGERMYRDKISPQQMYVACSIVTRGSSTTTALPNQPSDNCSSQKIDFAERRDPLKYNHSIVGERGSTETPMFACTKISGSSTTRVCYLITMFYQQGRDGIKDGGADGYGHIVPSALRSSTATVKVTVVWNSWSRRYAPHMRENRLPVRIIRRQKATPEDSCTDHQVCCTVGDALGLE